MDVNYRNASYAALAPTYRRYQCVDRQYALPKQKNSAADE